MIKVFQFLVKVSVIVFVLGIFMFDFLAFKIGDYFFFISFLGTVFVGILYLSKYVLVKLPRW